MQVVAKDGGPVHWVMTLSGLEMSPRPYTRAGSHQGWNLWENTIRPLINPWMSGLTLPIPHGNFVSMSSSTTVDRRGQMQNNDSAAGPGNVDQAVVEEVIEEHQSIPVDRREQELLRSDHRCQIHGCLDRDHGGQAQVVVQRIRENPQSCGRDDLPNLTARCVACAATINQSDTPDPSETRASSRLNGVSVSQNWLEILAFLERQGPASVSEISSTVSISRGTVHRALNGLLSLDIREESIDKRVVVKDRSQSLYGVPRQIPPEDRARGTIPLDPAERRTRILDELALQLRDQLPAEDQDPDVTIAEIIDRNKSWVSEMCRRAQAFQFPWYEWVDERAPRRDGAGVIDAVDLIAKNTNAVPRQTIASTLINLFEQHGEHEYPRLLAMWADHDQLIQPQSAESDNRAAPRDINLAPRSDTQTVDKTVRADEDSLTRIDHTQSDDSQR